MSKLIIKTIVLLALNLTIAPSWAVLPYIQPFPDFINSGFGPRLDASSFHGGLDYAKPYGTPIPAIMDGQISEISSDLSGAGIRLYLTNNSDHKEIGYYHLFRYVDDKFVISGDLSGGVNYGRFILVKNYKFSALLPFALRFSKIEKTCDVILSTVDKIAYVPSSCWSISVLSGSNVVFNNISYAAKNTVKQFDLIAPVGNSLYKKKTGILTAKGPHLHIQDGRGDLAKHPMYSLEPTSSKDARFFARLDLLGTDTLNSNVDEVLAVSPTVSQATLNVNKFIDVRVDSTNSLDLDSLDFSIAATNSTKSTLIDDIQYSAPNRSINSTPKTIEEFKQSIYTTYTTKCPTKLKPGEVAICPEVDWKPIVKGVKTGQRLVTRFRLGVDPDMFAPGKNTVNVTLKHAQSPDQPQFIPFDFTVTESNELSVKVLSASCVKQGPINDSSSIYYAFRWLIIETGIASGPVGTVIMGYNSTYTPNDYSFVSCGNWTKKPVQRGNMTGQCIRENGQPNSTSFTSPFATIAYNYQVVFNVPWVAYVWVNQDPEKAFVDPNHFCP